MAIGTVKWFDPAKGYGFIKPDGGGKDVFVHVSAFEKAGYTRLAEGAKISYELLATRLGKTAARSVENDPSETRAAQFILAHNTALIQQYSMV